VQVETQYAIAVAPMGLAISNSTIKNEVRAKDIAEIIPVTPKRKSRPISVTIWCGESIFKLLDCSPKFIPFFGP